MNLNYNTAGNSIRMSNFSKLVTSIDDASKIQVDSDESDLVACQTVRRWNLG